MASTTETWPTRRFTADEVLRMVEVGVLSPDERVELVEALGMAEVRKIPGFHDEPLKGERKGQRSIRLNRSWRAVYVEMEGGATRIVEVQEVHKHEY